MKLSAKYECKTERSATIELSALGAIKFVSEARDENLPTKRADFCNRYH